MESFCVSRHPNLRNYPNNHRKSEFSILLRNRIGCGDFVESLTSITMDKEIINVNAMKNDFECRMRP